MFKVGGELAVYADENELIESTKYYLNSEEGRGAIAKRAQTYGNIEVIVVDNYSTDRTMRNSKEVC